MSFQALITSVKQCTVCDNLPLGPKPIFQLQPSAKILIAGQAPGRITHGKGIPFDDPSGVRLREWMGINQEAFYDASKIAILPMSFCYPGTAKGGDLPPRPECATHWRHQLLERLVNVELTLVIGRYALDWHLGDQQKKTLTATVDNWKAYWPSLLPMPHPSPRNNRWLKNNSWYEKDILPELKRRVSSLVS